MAFPAVETTAESATTGTGTSHVVTLPSGIVAGNLLLVLHVQGGTSAYTINTLSGWSELIDEGVLRGLTVLYRQADGSEGADITLTSSASNRSASIAYRISGAANPGTQAPQISTVATGTSTAPNPASLSPTGGAKDYLWITLFTLAGEEADDDTWVNNAATNYSNLLQKTSGTGGTNVAGMIASCHRTNNAASEDAVWPAASTDQSLAWRAFTIAVHPGAAAFTGTAANTLASFSSSASGTFTADTVPDAVDDLDAAPGDTEVDLTWTAPADGGAAITDYVVQYRVKP